MNNKLYNLEIIPDNTALINNLTSGINYELGLGFIKVSGAESQSFLQGQLTCNVMSLAEQQATFTAYCNIKGRVHFIANLFCRSTTEYILAMPKDIIEHAVVVLKKYGMFSKISIEQVQLKSFGLIINSSDNPELTEHALKLSNNKTNNEHDIMFINVTDYFKLPDYKVFECYYSDAVNLTELTPLHDLQKLCSSIDTLQADSKPEFAWSYLYLISKIPLLNKNSIEQLLPHYINLPELGIVSFNKGCYTGQEIVARMHYKGNIKKHLYLAKLSSSSKGKLNINIDKELSMQEIFNSARTCGNVINYCTFKDTLYLLCMLNDTEVTQ